MFYIRIQKEGRESTHEVVSKIACDPCNHPTYTDPAHRIAHLRRVLPAPDSKIQKGIPPFRFLQGLPTAFFKQNYELAGISILFFHKMSESPDSIYRSADERADPIRLGG